jgi:hypothetical protein
MKTILKINFTFERECVHSVRYKQHPEPTDIPTIYIKKSALDGMKEYPKDLTLTLEV